MAKIKNGYGGQFLKSSNRLFVYGIFLGEQLRNKYGMTNPEYDTVPGYITVGNHIVQAVPVRSDSIQLTGLTVDVDPEKWESIDTLEYGYDRVLVRTSSNEMVNMYVAPERS